MNTYALSNCLTLSPGPFVSYKGQKRKVTTDNTFLQRQISVRENQFCWIDFHLVKLSCSVVFFANSLDLWLNEFLVEFTICKHRPQLLDRFF